jgi:hypothetical protein
MSPVISIGRSSTVPYRTLATLGLAVLAAGCRDAVSAWAPTPPVAYESARSVSRSLQLRFESPERDSRYDHARLRLARYALAPSALANDSLWTTQRAAQRILLAAGAFDGSRYRLRASAAVSAPTRVGDSRHEVTLEPLADGDWRWTTRVDHAIGPMPADAIARVFTAWLRSAERAPDAIRADYLTTAPRLTRALGTLATLDTVRTVRLPDGSTRVALAVRLHADRIASTYPDFSRYLTRYVTPARYTIELRDLASPGVHANDVWFIAEAAKDVLTFRFRSRDGVLAPLEGPLRPRPDVLAIRVSASAKFGPFTVGVRELRGRFEFVRDPGEVGWAMRFANPPTWDLPPIAGRLVRGSLDRPFAGDGAQLRLTVRRGAAGTAVIHRATDLTVRESTVLRWLGNLGFTAVDDFAGRVEAEEARFLAAALRALGDDVGTLRSTGAPR